MVIIYSTPTCVYCKTLKEYLSSKNIPYKEVDVSENEKELEKMVAISGQMGVPVVEIDDNVIVGFDREKIDEILKIK
ncbi:MAG TPA: glutaredoxin family protein [Negativicutes bacterium]|nr:glutaredoxin family protein [Negativicutes bacterium]